jgi:hypothetical protein
MDCTLSQLQEGQVFVFESGVFSVGSVNGGVTVDDD